MNVLFVCTMALQRSPTAADVFSDIARRKNVSVNIKYAGIHVFAAPRVDNELITWADKIYAMEELHKNFMLDVNGDAAKKIHVLGIPDIYLRNSPELVRILHEKLEKEVK